MPKILGIREGNGRRSPYKAEESQPLSFKRGPHWHPPQAAHATRYLFLYSESNAPTGYADGPESIGDDQDVFLLSKQLLHPFSADLLVIELDQGRRIAVKRGAHRRSSRSAIMSCAQLLDDEARNWRVLA